MSRPAPIVERATDAAALGPAADADWTVIAAAGAISGREVVAIPDASNPRRRGQGLGPIQYYRYRDAVIAFGADGAPIFGLTLIVSRDPPPDEHLTVSKLIVGGIVNMDVTIAAPANIVTGPQYRCGTADEELRPLFVRSSDWVLKTAGGDGVPIVSANASGTATTASLASHLDADTTRSVVAALRNEASDLELSWTARFRARAAPIEIEVRGQWATVHDHLSGGHPQGYLTQAELRRAFDDMLAEGLFTVYSSSRPSSETALDSTITDAIFAGFRRNAYLLLTRESTHLQATDPENIYQLRSRPAPSFEFSFVEEVTGDRIVELERTVELRHLIQSALGAYHWDRFVKIVVAETETGQPREVRRKARSRANRLGTVDQPVAEAMPAPQIVARKGRQGSIETRLANNVALASPAVLAASDAAKPVAVNAGVSYWAVADTMLVTNDNRRSLPIIDNASRPPWPDRRVSRTGWYTPEFEVVMPTTNATHTNSPFTFRFERSGATSDGEPGLDATILFTLRKRQPSAAAAAVSNGRFQRVQEVTAKQLTVHLTIPFRDSAGRTRRHAFPAEITLSGNEIQARVAIVNEWVRLAYGVLAYPDFQTEPAQVRVSFKFEGYYEIPEQQSPYLVGGKTAVVEVAYNAADVAAVRHADTAVLDAVNFVYHDSFASSQLQKESAERVTRSRGVDTLRPVKTGVAKVSPPLMLARPPRNRRYGIRHFMRQQVVDLLVPCAGYGAVYTEVASGEERAIGCRDALRLGEIEYRMYEEIGALTSDRFRVLRSLQRPGRFMVLPSSYRISRMDHDTDDPYRPMVMVYSSLDVSAPENNRVIFDVGLEPDLAPFERAAIRSALREYAQSPVLEYPTEIESDASYTWAVPSGVTVEQFRMPNGFRVALKTDLASALLLKEMLSSPLGLSGSVSLRTADGVTHRTNLDLGLRDIIGPWERGPLGIDVADNGELQLSNHTEAAVDVAAVHAYSADDELRMVVPVEQSIAGEERIDVEGTELSTDDALYAEFESSTSGTEWPAEKRLYVEDVFTNIILINLINLENRGLAAVVVDVEIPSITFSGSEMLDDLNGIAEIAVVLPLFSFIASVALRIRVRAVGGSATGESGRWIDWDLKEDGHVISITPAMINQ
ncbi:MAG: hypothetical protein OER22_03890 [Gammaproteobacteria bacterium]|nr:hypothetical protein [Gammaproteobacteria bacterium]MDH3373317.1 hypothetical protein [Gammaproteobacteria bacterium]MDH3408156.1 hypothetical protein [Gammaproteobacteria bacterium]MDH3551737.1 hypothetical protein [Gammaproteobacteria bacterium]